MLRDKAKIARIEVAEFREPDLDNALTAIALGPAAKKLVQKIPMALA